MVIPFNIDSYKKIFTLLVCIAPIMEEYIFPGVPGSAGDWWMILIVSTVGIYYFIRCEPISCVIASECACQAYID